jgi:mono/diheme cytochrome c family protein
VVKNEVTTSSVALAPAVASSSVSIRDISRRLSQSFFVLLLAILATAVATFAQESHIGNLNGNLNHGKQVYQRYCIGCHGVYGNGKGENAPYLDPKPRDFTTGTFKCRSTPSGSLPQDDDVFRTIGRGVDTTGMPSWGSLTNQQRADLVAYIKTFSPRFHDEKPDPAIPIPPETVASPDSVERGKVLYQETLKCWQCHGTTGIGDGPSAYTLRDNKDDPIVPYDFRDGSRFKCGDTDEDLYRIFMTGLDGTPMPSYADYLKPVQAWDLVHYLRTLQVNYKSKRSVPKQAMALAK